MQKRENRRDFHQVSDDLTLTQAADILNRHIVVADNRRIEETGANSGAEINSVIVHTLSHTALQLSVASEGISEPQIQLA